jgi:hypothetical protein
MTVVALVNLTEFKKVMVVGSIGYGLKTEASKVMLAVCAINYPPEES